MNGFSLYSRTDVDMGALKAGPSRLSDQEGMVAMSGATETTPILRMCYRTPVLHSM